MSETGANGRGRSDAPFAAALRNWRTHRGLSQLELSLDAGVSSRHLSCLETGKAMPSRPMVMRLMEALAVPLRDRNRLLVAAGFAPAYTESGFGEEQMALVRKTVRVLLERHEPYPAYALDGAWNIIEANRPHRALLEGLLGPTATDPVNILDLVFAPHLLRPHMLGWETCAAIVLRRAIRQVEGLNPHPMLRSTLDRVLSYPGVHELRSLSAEPERFDLFVPLALRIGDQTLRWLTTIMTFAGAVDVVVDELVVECFFPADETTDRAVRAF